MKNNFGINLGSGAALLVISMTANATWIEVATDTLTYSSDIYAQTSANWGSCADNEPSCTTPSVSLTYTVSYEIGLLDGVDTYKWLYEYQWFGSGKDLSHIIIELSENFVIDDIISSNIDRGTLSIGTYSSEQGNSNPGILSPLYGMKIDLDYDTEDYSFSIESWRAPEWGDFYAKDGRAGGNNVYAYNRGFGDDPFLDVAALIDRNFDAYLRGEESKIMRPDTVMRNPNGGVGPQQIPEPTTLALLGLGLVAMAGMRRRRLDLN